MSAGSPDYTREVSEGVDYIFSGLPIGFFNVALLTGRGVSADALTSQGQTGVRLGLSAGTCRGCSSSRTTRWRLGSMRPRLSTVAGWRR